MFNVGDLVELDKESYINQGWDGDELKLLESMGLKIGEIYQIENFLKAEEDFLGDHLPRLVELKDNTWSWSEDRFKLAIPLNLENE